MNFDPGLQHQSANNCFPVHAWQLPQVPLWKWYQPSETGVKMVGYPSMLTLMAHSLWLTAVRWVAGLGMPAEWSCSWMQHDKVSCGLDADRICNIKGHCTLSSFSFICLPVWLPEAFESSEETFKSTITISNWPKSNQVSSRHHGTYNGRKGQG